MAQNVPAFRFSDDALRVRQFVYEHWCAHGRAPNLREAHERPEGMEEAAAMMVGLEVDRVRQGLAILATQPRGNDRSNPHGIRPVADYSMPNVSDKVLRIIHSYTDYVNRVVWKKY